jgi:7-cyano-7-deazaguanine synthase in queuosine biosynthesis
MSSTDNTHTLDNTAASVEIDKQESTSSHDGKVESAHCDRCERRKIRERGYAREARLRKKLAQNAQGEATEEAGQEHTSEE